MKVKASKLLTTIAVLLLLSLSVLAQEEMPVLENPDPTHRELNLDEDKTLIYDHANHTSTVKDTTIIMPRLVPTQSTKISKPDTHKNNRREKEEEDALSFNFLYYMIQKFKLSDLIDQ